jgi:epoxyqueuosine reductase
MAQALAPVLAQHALCITGVVPVMAADDLPQKAGSLLLISPDEPGFWPLFTQSPEYHDGAPHALDRWSRRVGDRIAQDHGLQVIYPFGGPPFQPFYSWALRSGRAYAAPIGFLVHVDRGLFISYRMALLVPWQMDQASAPSPCLTCADQPCRSACPVDAFASGYDVAACKGWLQMPPGQDCMTTGCAARRACPVGQGRRLPAQAAFHMKDFL